MNELIGKIGGLPQKEHCSYIGTISEIRKSNVNKKYDLVYLDFFNSNHYVIGFLSNLVVIN
jgi:hypothetical protein